MVQKPRVLVLGTFHMVDHPELHYKIRQEEIEEVISRLF